MTTVLFDSIDSYTDLGLFLAEAEITEPEAKRTLVEVPGRDGQLDLSYALSSTTKYKNRSITFVFKAVDYSNDWVPLYSSIANRLHGKRMRVTVSSDPDWYWDSFVTVEHSSEFNVSTINIKCDTYPYRLRDHSEVITSTTDIVNNGVSTVPTLFVNNTATVDIIGKNLLSYPYYYSGSKTINGVRFTVNSDGTITANGTATTQADYTIKHRTNSNFGVPAGQYILSGCASGGSSSTYAIILNHTVDGASVIIGRDYGEGLAFTSSNETDYYGVIIRIISGKTVSNIVFKPMVRVATDTDATYEPYHHANKTLQEGTYTDADFTLATGKNTVTTTGGATVIMQYTEKKL